MKWKLHRPSYLIGILMGICIGVGMGYMLAALQGLHRIGTDQEGEVTLGIAALRKLETNDLAGAKRVLHWLVADDYLDQMEKKEPWYQVGYQNSKVVERVEKAAKELPGLEAAIAERKDKRTTTNKARLSNPH